MKRKPTKVTGIAPRPLKGASKKKNHFIDDDGWNATFLSDLGLMPLLSDCVRLKYEIDSCVRGSYAVEGGDPQHLLEYLNEIKERFDEVYTNIEDEMEKIK